MAGIARWLLLTAALAAAAGCGGSNAGSGTSATIDPMAGARTTPVVVRATNRRTALLTNVRAASHPGFDRVVFQFRNGLPGYDVRYVRKPVRQDGSGRIVPVAGAHVVQIRMENALDADLTKSTAPLTYEGPRRFSPATPQLVELVTTGAFEGVLTWAAGLRDRVGFRVTTLKAPPRIVIDFRNR